MRWSRVILDEAHSIRNTNTEQVCMYPKLIWYRLRKSLRVICLHKGFQEEYAFGFCESLATRGEILAGPWLFTRGGWCWVFFLDKRGRFVVGGAAAMGLEQQAERTEESRGRR